MRILFVSTGYPSPHRPGHCIFIHRSIQSLLPYLEAEVVHFRAWLPGRPLVEKRHWEGVPVTTIYCPQSPKTSHTHLNTSLLTFFGRLGISSSIKTSDLIHSTDVYPAGYIAQTWARHYAKPHTTHVIGSDVNYFLASNLSRIGTKWLSDINGFACNSNKILQCLLELAPEIKNFQVIYRGVDTTLFSPEGHTSGPQAQLPPVRFLFLGGFHSSDSSNPLYNLKGGPILLDAWKRVERSVAPSSLLVGGPGTDIAQLEKWRVNLARPDAVFLFRNFSPGDVPPLIRACDVLIIPSQHEGLPNLANEAQACARPVLGTDAGGIPESVIHTETGRIIPRGDVCALAEGLKWFHENHSVISIMGQRGRARMLQDFSWERFSNGMMALISNAI